MIVMSAANPEKQSAAENGSGAVAGTGVPTNEPDKVTRLLSPFDESLPMTEQSEAKQNPTKDKPPRESDPPASVSGLLGVNHIPGLFRTGDCSNANTGKLDSDALVNVPSRRGAGPPEI